MYFRADAALLVTLRQGSRHLITRWILSCPDPDLYCAPQRIKSQKHEGNHRKHSSLMKRLFSRRDKDKPPPIAPGLSLIPTTAPLPREDESQSTPTSKINGLLAPSAPGMSRRKSSFFLSVLSSSKTMNPSSQSGSDNGSAPPTSRSISGCSDTSSSYMSTPTDEQITPYASETGVDTKTWQSWMGSMTKGKSKKSGATSSSFSNVSRPTVPATVSLAHVSIADESSEDEGSEESTASSWEEIRPEDIVGNHKSRGKKAIRAPGDSGRRQLTPHSKQAQARSVFGGRAVAAPITKQTSQVVLALLAPQDSSVQILLVIPLIPNIIYCITRRIQNISFEEKGHVPSSKQLT